MSASKSGHADSAPDSSELREVTISAEELMRTRTQLVTGLTNISTAINEFVRSYVQHTDKWIGKESHLSGGIDITAMSNLFASGAGSTGGFLPATSAINSTPGKRGPYKKSEKKKRKEKDPNAPKRPLTAFFLYSQSARAIVKQDYENSGHTPAASEVSDEILRRWKAMTPEEQAPWKELYEKNADAYRKESEAYKAKTGAAPPEDHDEEAATAAGAAEATGEEAAADGSTAKPTKATKGKGKKKDAAPAGAASGPDRDSPSAQLISKVSAVPLPGSQPEAPAATPATKTSKRKSEAAESKPEEPPKKRKRKTKAEKEAEEAAKESAKVAAAETTSEKKKKSKAKKDKSSD